MVFRINQYEHLHNNHHTNKITHTKLTFLTVPGGQLLHLLPSAMTVIITH